MFILYEKIGWIKRGISPIFGFVSFRFASCGKPHLHASRPRPRRADICMRILLAAYRRSRCLPVFAFISYFYIEVSVSWRWNSVNGSVHPSFRKLLRAVWKATLKVFEVGIRLFCVSQSHDGWDSFSCPGHFNFKIVQLSWWLQPICSCLK